MSDDSRTGKAPRAGSEEGIEQPGTSRRSLLRGAAGLAGAGLAATAVTGAIAGTAMASTVRPGESAKRSSEAEDPGQTEPVVVHVRDARTGEMDIFAGTSQVRVHDRQLASKLVQAVK